MLTEHNNFAPQDSNRIEITERAALKLRELLREEGSPLLQPKNA
jgi:hypothetical protein